MTFETVKKATVEGPIEVQGEVMQLDFNNGKLACFVEEGSTVLSHYASGQILARLSVKYTGGNRTTRKQTAQAAVDRLVEQVGMETILRSFTAASTINP